MIIKILTEGGNMSPGPALSQKLGPAGINMGQVIQKVNEKTKMPNLLCKDLRSAVKSVVGTCVSLGILIENKPAAQIEKDIDNGLFDKEISKEKTETSDEKRKELDEFFSQIKSKQEQIKKQEQVAAEEAAKAAETTDDKAKTEVPAAATATKAPVKAEAKPAKKK